MEIYKMGSCFLLVYTGAFKLLRNSLLPNINEHFLKTVRHLVDFLSFSSHFLQPPLQKVGFPANDKHFHSKWPSDQPR